MDGRTYVRTYVRTYGRTFSPPLILLGRLLEVDLMTLIDAKFDADLNNTSEVTSHKTKWPRFFGLPWCDYLICLYIDHSEEARFFCVRISDTRH